MVTTDFTVRFEVAGPRPLKLGFDTSEISLSFSRRTKSEAFTCGVISSLSATSWRCTEVPKPKLAPGRPPAVPGVAPPAPGKPPSDPGNGRFWPTWMVAFSLSVVRMCGIDTTFTSPLFCSSCTNTPNDGTDVPGGRPRICAALGMGGPRRPAARPDSAAGENASEFTVAFGSDPPNKSDWLVESG